MVKVTTAVGNDGSQWKGGLAALASLRAGGEGGMKRGRR